MPKLNIKPSPRGTLLARERDNCTGWKCLTQAEQFGITFSIVVTSIILVLAYMCYLGKITQAHRELVLVSRRSRRRRRRQTPRIQSFPGVPLNQPLAIQILPNYPQGVMYQPTICNSAGTILPQPQPFLCPVYYSQPPPAPIAYSIPRQHEPAHFQPPHPFPTSTPMRESNNRNAESDSSSPRGLPPRQPTWGQRLARAVGLPVGRASTISSSSEERTPRRSRSRSRPVSENGATRTEIPREARLPTPELAHSNSQSCCGSNDAVVARTQDQRFSPDLPASSNEFPMNSVRRPQSLHTDAATVHSDDYEMAPAQIPNPPRRNASTPELPGTKPGRGVRANDSSPTSDSCSDERFTVPSESSIQSDFSPDLRPTTSGSLHPVSDSRLGRNSAHSKPMSTIATTNEVPRQEYRPDLASIASLNERLANRRGSRVAAFLQTTARTLWGQTTHDRHINDFPWPKYRPRPRLDGIRELQRREWERRRITSSETGDDEPSRPIQPPEPVHQGGGVYSRMG